MSGVHLRKSRKLFFKLPSTAACRPLIRVWKHWDPFWRREISGRWTIRGHIKTSPLMFSPLAHRSWSTQRWCLTPNMPYLYCNSTLIHNRELWHHWNVGMLECWNIGKMNQRISECLDVGILVNSPWRIYQKQIKFPNKPLFHPSTIPPFHDRDP